MQWSTTALPLLFLSHTALAAPHAEKRQAVVPARQLLCSGLQTGNALTSGDVHWAMTNLRKDLDINMGWWGEKNVMCTSTDGRAIKQAGVLMTYNHARNGQATATVKGTEKIACSPIGAGGWGLSCV